MGYYAKVINGIVTKVIRAEPEFFDVFIDSEPGEWIQTSYNTHGGVHRLGGTPLRKNYAGIGHVYDKDRDAFIPPSIYPSWVLNEDTCLWDPPVPYPDDIEKYYWDEPTTSWQLRKV